MDADPEEKSNKASAILTVASVHGDNVLKGLFANNDSCVHQENDSSQNGIAILAQCAQNVEAQNPPEPEQNALEPPDNESSTDLGHNDQFNSSVVHDI